MSHDPHVIPRPQQICALISLNTFSIISIQVVPFQVRVCANNMSWMKNAHQQWLTLYELKNRLGNQLAERLSHYDPLATFENYLIMDSELGS